MAKAIKKLVCQAAKWTGGFRLARRWTRGGLRILAYHGFALGDEGNFLPGVFMDIGEFRWRMEYLSRHGFAVLPLQEALQHLYQNTLPPSTVVLTFDDGFYSTWKLAAPVLREFKLPGTVYVTTYYCLKSTPVFRLAIRYIFWKTKKRELDLSGLGLDRHGVIELQDAPRRDALARTIFRFAEESMNEAQRVALCAALGERLGVDYGAIVKERIFSLMTLEEVREAVDAGLDIQLHTHRHVLSVEREPAMRELEENRKVLDAITQSTPVHFSYPSGIRHRQHDEPLMAADVLSATTCVSGFNYPQTPPLQLARFLDDASIPRVEFEAEISGFIEVLRRIRSLFAKCGLKFRPSVEIPRSAADV